MKLTLDKSWTLCLKQWAWIIKQLDDGSELSVERLKQEWLEKNGFDLSKISAGCFFCQYVRQHQGDCGICPGRKIDPSFDCFSLNYHYKGNPHGFYEELLSLNRKRNKKMK